MSAYNLPMPIPGLKTFDLGRLTLESGVTLQQVEIGYHTFGTINKDQSNVIWVCHALTANSDVTDWWSGLFGKGKLFDTDKYFIVCSNILGSCYGSTCTRSINPETNASWRMDFPLITIRDQVQAQIKLAQHLGIKQIQLAIGGSCGGHQVQELCLSSIPIKNACLLVTSAYETPYSIAIHEAQRLALDADQTLKDNSDQAGEKGLIAARGMGLIGYRTYKQYNLSQQRENNSISDYKASSYIQYQGHKLQKRFDAQSYFKLTQTLDTHDIGRNRGGTISALESIQTNCLIISISSDQLIPVEAQTFMAQHIPNNKHITIESNYGHDGFLIETEKIGQVIGRYLGFKV